MNSTFLDAFGANQYTAAQYQSIASGSSSSAEATLAGFFQYGTYAADVVAADLDDKLTVALAVNRANDPTDLLTNRSWADRQAALADQKMVFDTYGADKATYEAARQGLIDIVGSQALDTATSAGFVSSAENRTIWATISTQQFEELFGTDLLWVNATNYDTDNSSFEPYGQYAWVGNLGLDNRIPINAIGGVWFEFDASLTNPTVLDSTGITLEPGPLGIGNSSTEAATVKPAAIAANYEFPLTSEVATPAIAVIESSVPQQAALFAAYNQYRQAVGLAPVSQDKFQVVSGADSSDPVSGELTLDISTVAGGAPNSTQLLYSMLAGTPFAAYQRAFFDKVNDPRVLTSSWSATTQSTAGSPFYWAWQQLFVDGALRNVSVHNAAGDQGATGYVYNGVANATSWQTSPFGLQVGGTSIADRYSAGFDSTLNGASAPDNLLDLALKGDPATVFSLVAAGLRTLPASLPNLPPTGAADTFATLFETVWQESYIVPDPPPQGRIDVGFGENEVGSGGIALQVPIPGYQRDFGLSAMTNGQRAIPDVAALSDADADYAVLNPDYVGDTTKSLIHGDGGTSAATPLWAALTAQIDAIFQDQGLPLLGYYNDLLYTAAAIVPASFNDITLGSNDNTFYSSIHGPDYNHNTGLDMVPTGNGYDAGPGYDLTTGLGTPNGTILARALTAIAHAQTSFDDKPPVFDFSDGQGPASAIEQSLLFQTNSSDAVDVLLQMGAKNVFYSSAASGAQAWTSRLAGQSLQSGFDSALATMFDQQVQGKVLQMSLAPGESVAVTIDASRGEATQGRLTTDFGFVDFSSPEGTVRVARPIAVAETVDALDDQTAIVRIRQDGTDSVSLTFYRIDDLLGSVNGLLPGASGYAAAAQTRAYETGTTGATSVAGPGYGHYMETTLNHVDAGDLIAMKLTDTTTNQTYWAFSTANEQVNGESVVHLWNYGLNTWGWEDQFGGGDHDFNDLIVGIDFTSHYGHGWLK